MLTERNPRERLADAMERRRLELRMRWKDVAAAGDIAYETLRAIRKGKGDEIRGLTKVAIETALRWAPGSVDVILSGGEPTPLEQPQPPSFPVNAADPVERDIWAITVLPEDIRWAYIQMYRRHVRDNPDEHRRHA
ncbi:hypothetical protein GCM10012275_38660 [Longimycelium tulufanense]|uniref:Uncharacterized protein n=1 Tax=Longimycelium tulufanense TaxID=907463 RepID=A0A8J3FX10_9PSEU|nr:hypothetical protein GCM10012275_38660 [Longimycelium tulufanense]